MRVLLAALATALIFLCSPAHAQGTTAQRIIATDVVDYACTTTGISEPQNIKVRVTLTMPATTTVGTQLTIGWQGTYAESTALKAPLAGLEEGAKLYAYAGISDYPGLTSATGVGTLDTITPMEDIALPAAQVDLLTTPNSAGTGIVRPGAINFGPSPTSPVVECEVSNRDELTTYTLEVPSSGQGGDPDPDTTDSESPTPDPTDTETSEPETSSPETTDSETTDADPTVTETPSGGAATGGGGLAGPDGRALVVTGFVVMLAALTGLRLRRGLRSS